MSGMMNQQATALDSVPDLEEGIIEKLHAAGITSVEMVADMTPEQLEEVPGIGPKTVEKISIAGNNYFSSLDAAAEASPEDVSAEAGLDASAEATAESASAEANEDEPLNPDEPIPGEGLPGSDANPLPEDELEGGGGDESPEGPDSAGMSGDAEGLSDEPTDSEDSVADLVESGQYFEAEVVDGVENAPDADEGEVIVHDRPETPQDREDISDEELPGPQKTGLRD
jgi:N utilization substance protein A